MYVKKMFARLLFTAEVFIFCGVYLFGKHSIAVLVGLQRDNKHLQELVQDQKKELANIERHIQEQSNPFYKEKIAREQLQMARKEEQVYYIAS